MHMLSGRQQPRGRPKDLQRHTKHQAVRLFLNRGKIQGYVTPHAIFVRNINKPNPKNIMGSRGKAPEIKPTVQFRPGVPPAPAWLDDTARTEYDRARDEIEAAGMNAILQTDAAVLATYAQAYSDVSRLTVAIREEGETVRQPNGVICVSPKAHLLAAAQRQLLAGITRLGFSPKDRKTKFSKPPSGPVHPDDDFASI